MLRFPHNKLTGFRIGNYREQEQTIAAQRVNGGMVTSIDAADIENNQFADLANVSVRYDRTSRRSGYGLFSPAKPDSNKLLALVPFERFDGTVNLMRFTPTTVYAGSSSAWNALAGTLHGGTNDRFNTAIANDRMFFANNGADEIQEINIGALTFAQLGNAPKYKYITSFNNRILGANLVGSPNNPIKIGWCGNLNFAQWDAAVDPSAGFEILVDSPTDYADSINGIFGFEDVALVIRARSLWGMTKQPAASNPFNFGVISSGVGCDSPFSAVSIRNGIAWFDFRTGSVYVYTIGMQEPEAIGRPVENSIISQVDDPNTIFASYNTVTDEYSLAIPVKSSLTVRVWTFNFRTKAWWYDELYNASTLADVDYSSSSLIVDDLVGTIDSLVGTIDSLTNNVAIASRFVGLNNGDLLVQNTGVDTDNSTVYTTRVVSKTFEIPRHTAFVSALRIEYIPKLAGSFTISYSKDGGKTWKAYKTVSWTNLENGVRKLVTARKNLKCDLFTWKIESTLGLFDIIEYEVFANVSQAESKER